MSKNFKIGSVNGESFVVTGQNGERYRNVVLSRDTDEGFTRIYVILTKDTAGRVSVAWSHDAASPPGRAAYAPYIYQ